DESIFDNHRQSVANYNSYLASHSARAVDYIGRAMDFVTLRDYENAMQDVERAIGLTPDYPLAYFLRGQIRHRMLQLSQSDADDSGHGADVRGRASVRRMALEEALSDFDKVVELSPRMAPAWFDKANLHFELGDYTSAIAAYTQALELAPEMGQAYYNRGYIYLKLGNRQAGISDLSKAGELGILPAYNLIKRMSAN
ncbi:MAG: tetratricopeptide repeat protein, partial [Muribaculaceae bacterium]|nr:tetratricopeptide repeat protein [Muribaculaceae bacterium]